MGISADRVIAVRTEKTVYREGETVIKVFVGTTPGVSVLREAMNQAAAYEAGLPVPQLLETSLTDGKWAIRSRYIRGKTLRQLMQAEPDKMAEHMKTLARIQTEIHRVTEKQLFSLREKMFRRIAESALSEVKRTPLLEQLSQIPECDTLCHGELTPSNLLISADDGRPYILDWAHAARGDAALDAALTFVLLNLHEHAEETGREYLRVFCRLSGVKKERVLECVPAAAASLMSKYGENKKILLGQFIGGYQ